ncbi:DUF5615 family PIN-like protein [Candidatus Poribacteria bacterium]|nr:DUF5615 family PIN-like protein [Candidatus Poribacteria bacterium]
MSLIIYLDDCSDDDDLIAFLIQAGHTVISPRAAGTKGWDDPDHLEYAATHGYVLFTHNPPDFRRLHRDWQAQGRTHAGIFLIYRDNNMRKDMTHPDIVRAIVNEIHILNQWQ